MYGQIHMQNDLPSFPYLLEQKFPGHGIGVKSLFRLPVKEPLLDEEAGGGSGAVVCNI